MGTHGVEGTTHVSSFSGAMLCVPSGETSKNPLFRRPPYSLVFSSLQFAISFSLVSLTIWAILPGRVCVCTRVGRSFTLLYLSGSLVLEIWNRVVSIHSSKRTLLVQITFQRAKDEEFLMMYFVVAIRSNHSGSISIFRLFVFERCLFLLFFVLLQVSPSEPPRYGRRRPKSLREDTEKTDFPHVRLLGV